MAKLSNIPAKDHPRARRWDAIVLGSSLPGLVAAARLAMQQKRVMVLEEECVAQSFAGLREPFLLFGSKRGVLEACLRELTLPLIERRRIEADPVAFQAVLPEARVNLGDPGISVEELVTWGLAKPDAARALVRALLHAASAEATAMLAAPVVKSGALGNRTRYSAHGRGLPEEVGTVEEPLATLLDAQVRALSNLAEGTPPPEARARLLGAPLEGGAGFASRDFSLHELLRRRIQSLHGEFRATPKSFTLAAFDQRPAIVLEGSNEIWVGETLLVNAPPSRLALALANWKKRIPGFLEVRREPTHRRVVVHLRAAIEAIPEGMGHRVLLLRDPTQSVSGHNVVSLVRHPLAEGEREVDLVASAVLPEGPASQGAAEEIAQAVTRLMPFSQGQLEVQPIPEPVWDDEWLLGDPPKGSGWPMEVEIRRSSRPPVFVLAREELAALGFEGDLLLGWRAGDAVARELA